MSAVGIPTLTAVSLEKRQTVKRRAQERRVQLEETDTIKSNCLTTLLAIGSQTYAAQVQ